MLHHIALHCDATSGVSMSPLGLYHIWVLSVLETLPYLYDTMSSGIIEIPDVALQCIAAPELHCIAWYQMLHCIALQPRVALHCIAAPDISMFPILHSSVLESYQYLKLFHIRLTLSSKVLDRVNQFNLCPNAKQYLQKVFDPLKPHNLNNLLKPVKRALTLFPKKNQLSTSKGNLSQKLIVVKLSNQKSPTL